MILDEEQRFGVAQKELLRSLRLEVDVLDALGDADPADAAHVALRPARHLDHRDAAGGAPPDPHDRRASTTRSSIKVALERELARGGQVFYLHNRVETIDEAARSCGSSCPGSASSSRTARCAERELEEQMHAFLARRRRRARLDDDHRVRARHPAGEHARRRARRHARPRPALPDPRPRRPLRRARRTRTSSTRTRRSSPPRRGPASRRSPTTPSSAPGFQIAMRDLEIRGAGDLLGAEQSGHVAAVGFELYVELLDEAVAELSGERRVVVRPVRVDARVDAYVPATYVASEASRSTCTAGSRWPSPTTSCASSAPATEDRYGPLPEPVENLFAIQEAKLKLALIGADYLVYRGGRATVGRLALGSDELRALRRPRRHGGLTTQQGGEPADRTVLQGALGSPML